MQPEYQDAGLGNHLSLSRARDWIQWAARQLEDAGVFFGHGTDNSLDEAAWLVSHAMGIPVERIDPDSNPEVQADMEAAIRGLLRKRIEQRVPLAYLTGRARFAGLAFEVTPQVLVPRSPVAELIMDRFQPWVRTDTLRRVLDLCTGSGCIAVACALQFPEAEIIASDISHEALEVARRNIEHYGLAERVTTIQSDLFASLGPGKYDLIVSNPPYVPGSELAALPAEYQAEPALALLSGMEGLEFPLRILAGADGYLNEGGVLVCEVGETKQGLAQALPAVEFLWLEFASGGDGVFLLEKQHTGIAAAAARKILEQC